MLTMEKQGEEVVELRRAVRDLSALSTMMTVWVDCDPRHLAEGVIDLLFSTLGLDVAYICLQASDPDRAVEAWRGQVSPNFLRWLRGEAGVLQKPNHDSDHNLRFTSLAAHCPLQIAATQLGVQVNYGRLILGSIRPNFPGPLENLLLSVAASEAVVAFQLQQARTQLAQAYDELRITQEKELKVAAFIQQGLMAGQITQCSFAAVSGRNISCKEVGGDFFTVGPVDKGVAIAVADVSGKGTSAAIMASLLEGMIQADWQARVSLPEIARKANDFLCARRLHAMYATLVIAYVQPDGSLEYINCGHIPPVVTIGDGDVVRLPDSNLPVGLLPDTVFMSAEYRLNPGEHFILVTDGVTEAANPHGDFFGDGRLERAAGGIEPLEQILASVDLFCAGTPLQDDCTVLELAYLGKDNPPKTFTTRDRSANAA